MPLNWLCYRHNNQISVVIEPGASIIHARMRAAAADLDEGEFTEGHELDRKSVARQFQRPRPSRRFESSTLSATSSLRRKAPAKPTRMIARLRSARSDVAVGDMAMTMSAVAAFFLTGAAPIVRRIPDRTAFTFSSPVGVS